jgi:hypothetical protein
MQNFSRLFRNILQPGDYNERRIILFFFFLKLLSNKALKGQIEWIVSLKWKMNKYCGSFKKVEE